MTGASRKKPWARADHKRDRKAARTKSNDAKKQARGGNPHPEPPERPIKPVYPH